MASPLSSIPQALLIAALCLLVTAPAGLAQEQGGQLQIAANTPLQYRWFFSFGYGRNRDNVEKIKALIDTAAVHGLNGMVLSSFGLDSITRWDEGDISLLKEIADYCAEKQIELIPTGFSAGYGGGVLGHDRSFAAALPTTIPLRAKGGRMVPAAGENLLTNGDLEEHADHRFAGFDFNDGPGVVSFAEGDAVSGKSSIRFELAGANEHGHGRIAQQVAVEPGHIYRFSFKVKTEDLEPISRLKAMVYVEGRELASLHPRVEATQDWTEITLDFINTSQDKVFLYAGIWGGKAGKFWLDDLRFYQYGSLADIARREGTPLQLKSRDRDAVFIEGEDFAAIQCRRQLDQVDLLPGSAIREGEQLELACYKIPYVSHSWGRQISLCMSNPALYEYWEAQARKLYEIVPYKKVLLAMDEIRNGGGCALCRQRGISMAEILGDCISRQYAVFKAIDPEIEVLTWSDMLDPAHNARDQYYGVVGDYTGSWNFVPRDLTMMCWYHRIRDKSLEFFAGQGFRTFGAAYYDGDDLSNPQEWLASLKDTPAAQGIMYTTWERKYELLAGFGDLLSGDGGP